MFEAIEVIQQMAAKFTDEQIATTRNRLGLRAGTGNTWNEIRVRSARHHHQLPAFDPARQRQHNLGRSGPTPPSESNKRPAHDRPEEHSRHTGCRSCAQVPVDVLCPFGKAA